MSIKSISQLQSEIKSKITNKDYTTGEDVESVLNDMIESSANSSTLSDTVLVTGDNSTRSSRSTEVESAVNEAINNNKKYVLVPGKFGPQNGGYDMTSSLLSAISTFDGSIIREGNISSGEDVRAYGAYPGQVSTDNFKAAIFQTSTIRGGLVHVPRSRPEDPYIVENLSWNKINLQIVGEGGSGALANGATMISVQTDGVYSMKATVNNSSVNGGPHVSNITFIDQSPNGADAGFRVEEQRVSSFNNCSFKGAWDYGLDIVGGAGSATVAKVNHCRTRGCQVGIRTSAPRTQFLHCWLDGEGTSGNIGIKITDNTSSIVGGSIDKYGDAIVIDGRGNHYVNTTMENNENGLRIESAGQVIDESAYINNNADAFIDNRTNENTEIDVRSKSGGVNTLKEYISDALNNVIGHRIWNTADNTEATSEFIATITPAGRGAREFRSGMRNRNSRWSAIQEVLGGFSDYYLMSNGTEAFRVDPDDAVFHHNIRSSPPSGASNGAVAYADGTNWDPGSGEGFYGHENGSWVKL